MTPKAGACGATSTTSGRPPEKATALQAQVTHWTTPDCNTSTYSNGKMGPNIREQASNWPTPSATVMNDGEAPETWHARAQMLKLNHTNGNGAGLPLTVAAVQWPTPNVCSPNSMRGNPQDPAKRKAQGHQVNLHDVAGHWKFSPQAQPTQPGQESSAVSHGSDQRSASKNSTTPKLLSRRLNPMFVEILMGWPLDWTSAHESSASSAAETALWRSKLRQRLCCLFPE
jgi:hypothetical protein